MDDMSKDGKRILAFFIWIFSLWFCTKSIPDYGDGSISVFGVRILPLILSFGLTLLIFKFFYFVVVATVAGSTIFFIYIFVCSIIELVTSGFDIGNLIVTFFIGLTCLVFGYFSLSGIKYCFNKFFKKNDDKQEKHS